MVGGARSNPAGGHCSRGPGHYEQRDREPDGQCADPAARGRAEAAFCRSGHKHDERGKDGSDDKHISSIGDIITSLQANVID